MQRSLLFAATTVLPFTLACGGLGGEQPADIVSPGVYDRNGLLFSHPGNWTPEESTSFESGFQVVAVEMTTPGDALAIVQDYQPALGLSAEWFAGTYQDELAAAMGSMMGGVFTVEETGAFGISRTLAGQPADGFRTAFDVVGMGERIPHTVEVYAVDLPSRTLVVYLQVADEDHDKVEPGFTLILDSLVAMPGAGGG